MKTSSKWQTFIKIILGISLFFMAMEGMLRLGGLTFLSVQEYANRVSLSQYNEYRILCVGESTTALGGEYAYPRQLEKILNSEQNKVKFSVINKGIPSITTDYIASRLEKYLDDYKPHLVVAMIGVNDTPNLLLDEYRTNSFLKGLRTYKFFKWLWSYVLNPSSKELQNDPQFKKELKELEQKVKQKPTIQDYVRLALHYKAADQWQKERQAILKIIERVPNNCEAWGYLGENYRRVGQYAEAVEAFRKMVQLSPEVTTIDETKLLAYAYLAECYKLWGHLKEAEQVYLEVINYYPKHPGAYGCLGDLYIEQGRYEEAQTVLEQQLHFNAKAILCYGKLAHCYRRNGKYAAAERVLEYGIKFNPKTAVLYAELGTTLVENKKYKEAEPVLKKALELNQENYQGTDIDINRSLLTSYEGQGKWEEARELKKAFEAHQENYNLKTKENYDKIRHILSRRKIPSVAVQYPLRDIKPLKEMLFPGANVIVVDNKKTFEEAIAKENYDAYFTDRFAGDFGHCTPKGNHLLASNVAEVILKKIPGLAKNIQK